MNHILSWVCNGCGFRSSEARDLITRVNMEFWSEELGEGHTVVVTDSYSCDKCGKRSYTQWMTPDGCLRVMA